MTDLEKKNYAKRAYDTIQQLPHQDMGAGGKCFTLESLLTGRAWWMELSGSGHKQIGKYLAKHIGEFEEEYRRQGKDIIFFHQKLAGKSFFFKEKQSERSFLYHYTSLCAFKGIVDKGSIYLMNARNTNDETEIRFYPKSIFSMLEAETDAGYARIWQDEYTKRYGGDVYFASLTTLEDDAAQWERYGDDGWGVAMAFDREVLDGIVSQSRKAQMREVRYERATRSVPAIQKMVALYGKSNSPASNPRILSEIYNESVWHKHPSFRSESEVRILTSMAKYPRARIQREICRNGREYREFTEFALDKQYRIDKLIPFVRIGPRNKHSQRALEEDLRHRGFGISVFESECPLR